MARSMLSTILWLESGVTDVNTYTYMHRRLARSFPSLLAVDRFSAITMEWISNTKLSRYAADKTIQDIAHFLFLRLCDGQMIH